MADAHASPRAHYRISVPAPETHLAHVELRITDAAALGDTISLTMAGWSPGSYLIRDYARHVRQVAARTAGGEPRRVQKTSKDTWAIERGGTDELVVTYRVYSHDLTVRTSHIDPTHAFLHGPATYLMVEARRTEPCRVQIETPPGREWLVATGLDSDGAGFLAANVDELLDCPIHMGECEVRMFEAADVPIKLVVWTELDGPGVAGLDQLATDLSAIIDAHAARFGGKVPFRHYTFILMLTPGGYGGLEHGNSSANLHSPFGNATRKSYDGLLELLSHEFFHVWNGKRIFPAAFSPFDYHQEAYTRCLWVVEGITSYIDRYTLLRSGRINAQRYLEKLAEEWGRLLAIPGRSLQSLEEASFDAWIKLYKPDESNLNTTVSYYLKGSIVALVMDVIIRQQSESARSLDQVLALLWQRYGSVGKPYPEEVQPLFEEATGVAMGELFDRYIRGCEDPDMGAVLARAGLLLRSTWEPSQREGGRTPVWLGVVTGGNGKIAGVLDSGPAHRAGLSPGDEIIAVDGWRVASDAELRQRLAAREPGAPMELAVFRRGRLLTIKVRVAESPPTRIEIAGMDAPSPAQRAFYQSWLGEEHPGSGATAIIASASATGWL